MSWVKLMSALDGAAWQNKTLGLHVIESVHKELDGKSWKHVSVSRRSRIPSYEDLVLVKKQFIGEDKTAYQIFPKASHHVNIHPYCLHLWHCIDGDVTPDFTHGTGSI